MIRLMTAMIESQLGLGVRCHARLFVTLDPLVTVTRVTGETGHVTEGGGS